MFMIVSPDDCQVYEKKIPTIKGDPNYMQELIAYASLDMVDSKELETNAMYLKQVDKFNNNTIHCFVTPGRMRFLLLHQGTGDDTIRNFFTEVYEFYVKALMNPFLDKNSKITSSNFDAAVAASIKKHF